MRRLSILMAGLLLAPSLVLAAPAHEQKKCLWLRDIESAVSPNDHSILFHLRDRSVWRNDLRGSCQGLKNFGYKYHLNEDQICAGTIIEVLRLHHACVLSTFERVRR